MGRSVKKNALGIVYRHSPGRYMKNNKTLILRGLQFDSEEIVAMSHGIQLPYFQKVISIWKTHGEEYEKESEKESEKTWHRVTSKEEFKPKEIKAPPLCPGELYRMKNHKRPIRYIEAVPGRTPDGKHYLFENEYGGKESFTVFQLCDDIIGKAEGEKWKSRHLK